ncbi:centrosomal protein of 68 kDa [Echinops telfairi]|uniref:Centrosomal protein of 68 kDa n=4 Tax=Echinops telfairi TaxID=9371 RepID=A0AC55DE42_ECHTE|nr:centrosomal protein of 68 kDa [Echinops telfairi]XP_045150009.1 centrosomal protein of 68 kDa [Echinops telfairi]XP_045150010.1 centrosomal protein of 68 kDa [Echinops telfairi]XP_045150011.1 centrosomal protein of 68 kDa [Echinops telfairi]
MALGEEKAEGEASSKAKTWPYGQWSCREQDMGSLGPVSGEQPPRLEAEGGPASPGWPAEGSQAPTCWANADPGGPTGTLLLQGSCASKESAAGGSKPAPSMRPGHFLHSVGGQLEETKVSALGELPQARNVPRSTVPCSGRDADTNDDPSAVESPRALDLSTQTHLSGFPVSSGWAPGPSPGTTAPQLSSHSPLSTSSPSPSLQSGQEKAEPPVSGSPAQASASLELAVPQSPPPAVGPGPPRHWSPQPMSSAGGAAELGRRRLSFQAEYWACALPGSLPPSPDRRSPLWNPNKEYEDLLDYTYPLRPPQHLDSHMLTDPVLQDSGVDLDSFSVSPASTLKSPTHAAYSRPPAGASALLLSGPQEPSLRCWPSEVSPKAGSVGLPSCGHLASTPRAPGRRAAPWPSSAPALRVTQPEGGSPTLRTRGGVWPSLPDRAQGAGPDVPSTPRVVPACRAEEELDGDDEFLALPSRLTQVSGLAAYLGSFPTLAPLAPGVAEGQSSLDISDSDGTASLPSHSSHSQLPSGAVAPGARDSGSHHHGFLHPVTRARRETAGKGSLLSSLAPGVPSGQLRSRPSCQSRLDRPAFLLWDAAGRQPGEEGEQGEASLMQCVKTFCCQLEELTHWLYNVAGLTDLSTPCQPSLTGLRSSLQLYRQFKNNIDEHQFLTERVLQKGELLLQCLLDSTPVLKDVLVRIAEQPGELERHANHVYDSILASLDMLAGCTLIPDCKPTAKERQWERV